MMVLAMTLEKRGLELFWGSSLPKTNPLMAARQKVNAARIFKMQTPGMEGDYD